MSASIKWRPTATGTYLPVTAPQALIRVLETVLEAEFPLTLTSDCNQLLKGALGAAKANNQSWQIEPLEAILRAIEVHGCIEIFAEY